MTMCACSCLLRHGHGIGSLDCMHVSSCTTHVVVRGHVWCIKDNVVMEWMSTSAAGEWVPSAAGTRSGLYTSGLKVDTTSIIRRREGCRSRGTRRRGRRQPTHPLGVRHQDQELDCGAPVTGVRMLLVLHRVHLDLRIWTFFASSVRSQ